MKRKPIPWYKQAGLKHVTGFLSHTEKLKLKKLAKAYDKSLTRYVTRLLQKHLRDSEDPTHKI